MKRITILAISICALIFACSHYQAVVPSESFSSNSVCTTAIYTNKNYCYSSESDVLCPEIPKSLLVSGINFGYSGSLSERIQVSFDNFGWQSFVALNWPAAKTGTEADVNKTIFDTEGDRVWERYFSPEEILSGKACAEEFVPKEEKQLSAISKKNTTSNEKFSEFTNAANHPLIDRNNNFVLFEAKFNDVEKDFICENKLYTLDGQRTYITSIDTIEDVTPSLDFPVGGRPILPNGSPILPTGETMGTTELKAAWRILEATDDHTRYYHRKATIVVPKENTKNGKEMIIPNVTVGLIGLHIVRKIIAYSDSTKTSASILDRINPWMWSTFEHVDNVPENLDATQMQKDTTEYSLYNPKCTTCPVAIPTDTKHPKWAKKSPYAIDYATSHPGSGGGEDTKYGSQITRPYPLFITAQCLNERWQKKLAGSVWANYKLISTQWRFSEDESPGIPNLEVDIPSLNGNTSMESFELNTASCASCHSFAKLNVIGDIKSHFINKDVTIYDTTYAGADHSFLLGHVNPKHK